MLRRSGLLCITSLGLLCVSAAWADAVAGGGRLMYQLNCLGCHPMPAQDVGAFGGEAPHAGAFYQTDSGRRFFIRMPAPHAPWTTGQDARLRDEIDTWRRICPAMKSAAKLIDLRVDATPR